MNCPEPCGKVRYPDRYRAMLACIGVVLKGGPAMEPYRAISCKCWHVSGHKKGKPRRGRTIRGIEGYRDDNQTPESSARP